MLPSLHPALILIAILLAPTCLSWTFSTTNINISYPPPGNSGIAVENDTAVGPQSVYPCANTPVDPSQARVPFPVSGGSFTYTLTNTSAGSLAHYEYIVDSYLGQISLGDGTYSTGSQSPTNYENTGYSYVDTEVFKNFQSGRRCSGPISVVELVSAALGKTVTDQDLVGMNATFGLRIVLFGENPMFPDGYDVEDYNQEEMYQCGYVTFTAGDLSDIGDGAYCNAVKQVSSTASPSSATTQSPIPTVNLIPTTLSTSRSSLSPTSALSLAPSASATGAIGANQNSGTSSHSTVAIGTGVGVSVGASILILAIGCFFLRRRRSRNARSETISPLVLVSPAPDAKGTKSMNEEKKDAIEKGSESSGSSVHSEPLPVYSEAAKEPQLDLKGKGEE